MVIKAPPFSRFVSPKRFAEEKVGFLEGGDQFFLEVALYSCWKFREHTRLCYAVGHAMRCKASRFWCFSFFEGVSGISTTGGLA